MELLEDLWPSAFPLLLIVGPMALVMLGGGLDLSIGSVMGLASVVVATGLANGQSPQEAFTAAMLFAGGIGLLHGVLVAFAGINSAVLTFVTAILIHKLAMLYAADLERIPFGAAPGFMESLYCSPLVLGAVVGISFILIQASQIGGGPGLQPVATQRWYRRLFFVAVPHLLSSLAAGLAGALLAAHWSRGAPGSNEETVLIVILAAVVGGNCTGRRFGTVIGATAGIALLLVLKHVLLLQAVSPHVSLMVLAGAACAALLLSQLTFGIVNRIYRRRKART